MPEFRKKPDNNIYRAEQFMEKKLPLPFANAHPPCCMLGPDGWYVITAHGQETKIVDGDWIMPEPDGRGYYPIKPDIFERHYEPVRRMVTA